MKKKFGVGTLSLILFIFAMVWTSDIKSLDGFCLGDTVLNFINLPAYSIYPNGNPGLHYTTFYSFAMLIIAIILGHKFPEHIFAKSGKILSIIFSLLFVYTWFVSSMTA
ncbi:hypothetical protein [Aminipila luticellarii]|uniref:Uncharacterized protein n=1 Tax=Aminipila luticellarii TaxID=2507160 RepID=A0A410PY03_9FIRM|nr:hypothetical protein [Aminipila luticellarii]QAT43857.1 hypothetical protein EQM06_11835 [Aminipila luticellarii]